MTSRSLACHIAWADGGKSWSSYFSESPKVSSQARSMLALSTFYSWVVFSIGVLIISIVMLKGVFSKLTAYLGIAVGIVATVAGFYVFLPALAVLTLPSLVAFGLWCVLAGRRLFRLGKPQSAGETEPVTAA
jgi:hypothetical protein